MPSLLDSLILEIDLRSEKFIKGQKDLQESFDKLSKDLIKGSKSVEEQGKKSAESIGGLARELQGLFALFAGGFAANAMWQFAQHISNMDSAVGRLGANIGAQPQYLSAWANAIKTMGGNADAAGADMQRLNNEMMGVQFGRQPSQQLLQVAAMGHQSFKFGAPAQENFDIFVKAIDAINRERGRERAFYAITQMAGLSPDMANLLLDPNRAERLRFGASQAPSEAQIKAAERLQEAMAKLQKVFESLERVTLNLVAGPLTGFLSRIETLLKLISGEDPSKIEKEMREEIGEPSAADKKLLDNNQGFGLGSRIKRWWYGDKAAAAETNSAGGAETSASGTAVSSTGGSSYLAMTRAKYFEELDRDPQLMRDVIKTASMEGGLQSNIEQMVNMAQMRGYSSLRQAIHSGFYGPVNRGGLAGWLSKGQMEAGKAAIAQVRGGSDITDLSTDQGLWSDPNGSWYAAHPALAHLRKVQGANFFDQVDRDRRTGRYNLTGRDWRIAQREAESRYNGIPDIAPFMTDKSALYGAQLSARDAAYFSPRGANHSSETHIGNVNVYTPETDASGISKHIAESLRRQTYVIGYNAGIQ